MSFMRARGLATGIVVAAGAIAVLGGCVGMHLSEQAPAGVNLTGLWKLDRTASDDPQKFLERMRAEARRALERQRGMSAGPDTAGGPQRRGRGAPSGASGGEDGGGEPVLESPGATGGPRPDLLRRSPMASLVSSVATRGDFLTIRQSASQVSFDYGNAYRRSFTPGAHSVVSAEGGVGDQSSGWKGRDFVIDVRAQLGPDVNERYSLSADGRQLTELLHISGGEFSAVELKRIYHPADGNAPAPLPSTD